MGSKEYLIVESFNDVDCSDLTIPMVVVYCCPIDFPGKYVARLFDMDNPTNCVIVSDNYQEIVKGIPSHMYKIKRDPNDEPQILETWL